MRWTVEGADRGTGQECVIQVEAATREEAEQIATGQGLLVSALYEPADLTPAEQLEKIVAERFGPPPQRPALDEAMTTPETTPSPVEYARPMERVKVPDYRGLRIGGTVLFVIALLYYLVAAGSAVLTIIDMLTAVFARSSMPTAVIVLGTATNIAVTLAAATVGVVMHVLSSGCAALRDIARNSFAE